MTLWAITGGNGYIARALADRLSVNGFEVRSLSRTPTGGHASVAGDIRDATALASLVHGADVVVHLAAYVHRAVRTRSEHEECQAVNVGGTAALIEAIAAHAPDAFLIHVSTANVYASSGLPLGESAPLAPETPYGRSKLEAERLVLAAHASHRVHGTVLRPAMVFGPGAPGNFARLVSVVRRGIFVDIGGGNRKSILPVETLIDAILAVAARRELADGEVFNVAGGEPLTMHEITLCMGGALGRKPRRVVVPFPLLRFGARLADEALRILPKRLPKLAQIVESYASSVVLDDTKLRSRLGFQPAVDVRTAIARAALSAGR